MLLAIPGKLILSIRALTTDVMLGNAEPKVVVDFSQIADICPLLSAGGRRKVGEDTTTAQPHLETNEVQISCESSSFLQE